MKTNSTILKVTEMMTEYSKATGSCIRVYDQNYSPTSDVSGEMPCDKAGHEASVCEACEKMHTDAIKESQRSGEPQIYTCKHGFMFWTSPIYIGGRFAGALLGGSNAGNGEERNKSLAELMRVCVKSLSPTDGQESRNWTNQQETLNGVEETKKQSNSHSEYPLDKEKEMLEALREGDAETGKKLLHEILAVLFNGHQNSFGYIQYRAIEIAVLLSRLGVNAGFSLRTLLRNDSRNLLLIQRAKTIEDIAEVLCRLADEHAGQTRNYQKMQHASSLRKAERYIAENYSRKISLTEIAHVSGFSAPYFSTIFKKETGENLSRYLSRLRVEKAEALLVGTNLPLNTISAACGFEDQSWFSKIFKSHTGMSPRSYRKRGASKSSILPETGFSEDYPGGGGQ